MNQEQWLLGHLEQASRRAGSLPEWAKEISAAVEEQYGRGKPAEATAQEPPTRASTSREGRNSGEGDE